VVKIPEYTEDLSIRTMPVDTFVLRDTEGRECESGVILCDVTAELKSLRIPAYKKSPERLGWFLQGPKLNLAMITAGAKRRFLGIGSSQDVFFTPMQRAAVRALYIHRAEVVAGYRIVVFSAPNHEYLSSRGILGILWWVSFICKD
jgi:hypothetical protein